MYSIVYVGLLFCFIFFLLFSLFLFVLVVSVHPAYLINKLW